MMMMKLTLLFFILAIVTLTWANDQSARSSASKDEIKHLPGWEGKLPSRQYSGFIDVSGTPGVAPADSMNVHYYYVESEGDPAKDPLILWSNGGPGASSMFGLLTEVGPLVLNDNSLLTDRYKKTQVPSLFYNEYGWTKFSGVLMFDWPPPTGFSYCNNNATGDGYSCGAWNDTRQAWVSYAALDGFFDRFPHLQNNGLHLAGESYAGVYIPKLAQQIISHSKKDAWNLRGVAIGDACMGTEVICGSDSGFGPYFELLFFYGHGAFSTKQWNKLMSTCGIDHLQYNNKPAIDAAACDEAIATANEQVGGYYAYNFYDTCTYENDFRRRKLLVDDTNGAALNDYVCGGGNAQAIWTDSPIVRTAINMPLDANFFSGDNAVGMEYDLTEKNLMPFFHYLATETDVKSLVYNGDTDPSVNAFTAENWTLALDLQEKEGWRPWTTDSCKNMGGSVTSYKGDFSFVTVRGSGHMVPTYKPESSFIMMQSFIGDKNLPLYDSKCNQPAARD